MIKFLKWFFSPSKKPIVEEIDVYSKLTEMEKRYNDLLHDLEYLKEENIEISNTLYQIMNSIEAVDARIDILSKL